MIRRIPQPPIQPASRARERHDFWLGFAAVAIALVLILCGARHMTGVETVDGGTAWETQLTRAFSSGGLQFADQIAPPPPPRDNDPVALERWAKQNAPPTWKVRVDAGATAACPT